MQATETENYRAVKQKNSEAAVCTEAAKNAAKTPHTPASQPS